MSARAKKRPPEPSITPIEVAARAAADDRDDPPLRAALRANARRLAKTSEDRNAAIEILRAIIAGPVEAKRILKRLERP